MLLFLLACTASNPNPDYGVGTGQVGEPINAFSLPDQDGETVDYSPFLGSPLVIDIAAVWCGPCQKSAESAEDLSVDLATDGVGFLTILVQDVASRPPKVSDARAWADEYDLTFPVLADVLQENNAQWGISAWPTLIFVDADGVVFDRNNGAMADKAILDVATR